MRRLVVVLVGSFVLVGCVPAVTPTPTPLSKPTFQCTPEAGGAAYPCDQKAFDDMLAKDALYAAAEKVIRAFVAAYAAQEQDVQQAHVSDQLRATITASYAESLPELFAMAQADGVSLSGIPEITRLWREPGISKAGSAVAMSACLDGRKRDATIQGRKVGSGSWVKSTYYLAESEGSLRITLMDEEVASSC